MSRFLLLHPTLGTGGGSRWSLQAAESLAQRGHEVHWVTSSPRQKPPGWRELALHSFRREFVHQLWPDNIADRGRALLASRRMNQLIRWCERNLPAPDAVLMDGVPFAIPRARARFPRSRIVFFCHFPELLYAAPPPWYLTAHRRHWICREREGLGAADRVLANSRYTLDRLLGQFPELAARASVCHPAVASVAASLDPSRHILCVARWAPEKNLPLAVRAFAGYRERIRSAGATPLPLVLAGGFDSASRAAQAAFAAVQTELRCVGLDENACRLLRDPSDTTLHQLYREALALVHPAPNEHFGMTGPEAMLRGIPVIGIAGCGLAETVLDGETGFLAASEPAAIAVLLAQLQLDPSLRARLGANARRHATANFLLEGLGVRLEAALRPASLA